jgi:alkyl hydroperoxide reductase subunit D
MGPVECRQSRTRLDELADEHTLREAEMSREALKAAAIISGVAQAITTSQTMAAVG